MIAQGQLKMDAMDLGKKSAVEKELEVSTRSYSFFITFVGLSMTFRSAGIFFNKKRRLQHSTGYTKHDIILLG